MQNRFFVNALEAAKISPEAFAAELKQDGADANVKKYSDHGDPLIHAIIEDISDEKLPDLLSILIQNGVNLESEDALEKTPLMLAVSYHKKNAIQFLIDHKANIKTCSLNAAIHQNDQETLSLMKILLAHGADINFQDQYVMPPLMHAVSTKSLPILEYLLSEGANLFSKYIYEDNWQTETAIGLAYQEYMCAEDDESKQLYKKCFDLLLKALSEYLYIEGLKQLNEALFITNAINDLSGHFYHRANSSALKTFLEENIKPVVLARIKAERMQAFCMGSFQPQTQHETKVIPTTHNFFQNDGGHDLSREIASYLQPPAKKQRMR